MSQFITTSREETVALGRRLAAALPDGSLIAFTGGLGAGKTAFCEGLAEGLGCTDPVSSPTFAIVNYYRGPKPLAHFDLYRISTENDLCAAGFYDYLDEGAIVAAVRHLTGAGLYAEPTSATALAAVEPFRARGHIEPGSVTVVVLTGSGLKAADAMNRVLSLR